MSTIAITKPRTREEKEARAKTILKQIKAEEKAGKNRKFTDWILWLRDSSRLPVDPAIYKDKERKEKKTRADMTWEDVMLRWPFLTANMICESLGYATPDCAARIILDAANNRENYCEWIYSCYNKDPRGALRRSIQTRKYHTGFMADINEAARLVLMTLIQGQPHGMLASWF